MATTNFSPLLGLALPTTGDLNGTWGIEINTAITSLLDSAVAGTTTLSTDADVTLTTTNGSANQARSAVILWTAAGTVTRNITAPAQSKAYVVINASSTQSIVIRGAGPTTGVTVLAGKKTLVAWNGSDFVAISSNTVNLTTDVTGILPVANGGTGLSSVTTNYVPYGANPGTNPLATSANFQFDGTVMRVGSNAVLGGTTNPVIASTGGTNNYIQSYIYNATNGASSSADFVAYANNSTDAHGWSDLGFTSASYADTTYTVTGPNEAYLFGSAPSGAGTSGNLVYATDNTGTTNAHQWYVGGFTQAKSAYKMQLASNMLTIAVPSSILELLETATITASAPASTTNFDVITQAVQYYTTNAANNFTLNIRGNSTTSLNTLMAVGQSATIALLVTNGSTAYYPNAFTIDGTSVTPKWQGGTAPTAGDASAIDSYAITVIKTASATFTVLASQTKFA